MSFAVDLAARTTFPLEAKCSGSDGAVEGYASTFGGVPDGHGDVIAPGAFTDTLGRHKAAGTAPLFLWMHDRRKPVGRWDDMAEDRHGLHVRGKINLGTTIGREAHAHVQHGDISGLSIGWSLGRGGAQRHADGTRTLRRIVLHEVSLVSIPSNAATRLGQRKWWEGLASQDGLAEFLASTGMDAEFAHAIAAKGWAGADKLGAAAEPLRSSPDPSITALLGRLDASISELRNRNR